MARPVSVNIHEVAKRAGVSTASVSRVLNNQSGVSEGLRLKIRKILEQDGVFCNHASTRGVKLAVVVEMIEAVISGYTAAILTGVADYALAEGIDISTVFISSREKQRVDMLELLRARNCDGVLFLFSNTVPEETLEALVRAKIAVFMFANRCASKQAGFFDTDPEEGIGLALQHLRHLGHKHVAFLSGLCENIYDNNTRAEVFVNLLRAAGLRSPERYLIRHQPTVHSQESGYLQARQALEQNPRITAFIANDDEKACGAMLACHERQLRVPQDISIVGFDDYPASRYTVPPLTTVRQPLQTMGHDAVKALDAYICGRIPELPRRVFRPELVVRTSTSPVRP